MTRIHFFIALTCWILHVSLAEKCETIGCMMECAKGFKTDPVNGCELCECIPEDVCDGVQCAAGRSCESFRITFGHKVAICTDPTVPLICHPPMDPGKCKASIRRWTYNAVSETCESFSYGGCDANSNNFETQQECETTCIDTVCSDTQCMMNCPNGFMMDEKTYCPTCDCVEIAIPEYNNPGACSEAACAMACEHGFMQDSEGCDICECVPSPECNRKQCRMFCSGGFKKDANGCQICECENVHPCSEIECRMACDTGFKKDDNGCHLCECNDMMVVKKLTPEPECSQKQCRMFCENGFAKDSNGCEICKCACSPINCKLDCEFGFTKDSIGCNECQCRSDPCIATECAPSEHCELAAIEDMVDPICVPGAAPKAWCVGRAQCRMACDNGFLKDEFGCDECKCRDSPLPDQCPMVKCDAGCQYGYQYNPDGCRTCNCLLNPCEGVNCSEDRVCEHRPQEGCPLCPVTGSCIDESAVQRMRISVQLNHAAIEAGAQRGEFKNMLRSKMSVLLTVDKEYIRGVVLKRPNAQTTIASFHVVTYGAGDLVKAYRALEEEIKNHPTDSSFIFEEIVFEPQHQSLSAIYSTDPNFEETDTTLAPPVEEDDGILYVIIGSAAGGAVLLIVIIIVAVCCCKKQRHKNQHYSKTPTNDYPRKV